MESRSGTALSVGVMTLVSLMLFTGMMAFLGRWQGSARGLRLEIRFGFLNNIVEGAPVRVAGGLAIGYVDKIYIKDLYQYVSVVINQEMTGDIPKNENTKFSIYTTGLMGQKYINVQFQPAQEGDTFFKDGDTVTGIDPPSVDQMLMSFASWFDGKNGGQVLAEILQETERFISNLNAIVAENRSDIRLTIQQARTSFTNLTTQLDVLLAKLNILSQNFTDISNQNKEDIQVMLRNMALISRDLNLITERINSGQGSVGRFIRDEELYQNTNQAVINARELFRMLKDRPWLIMYKEN